MQGGIDSAATDCAGATGRLVCGRYRLLDPIGRGAMGIVWRGRDELLDRAVAVKEVRIAGLGDRAESDYQRTLREAKAAARLNHPGVVTVFDVVEEGGRPWIVMELVPARSLDLAIAEDGPLRPLQAARLGEHLVSALACAHAAGVLHRDVKPGNVLLGPDDRLVLTDFGIATLAGDPALTAAGMVFGTPGFTAPERIRGHDATPASDLWSVGATLYTAVEGRGPFGRPGGSAAITAGVAGEPAPRAPSAGPLGPVIEALLRADPDQRPDAATAARLLAEAAAQARSGWPRATGVTDGPGSPAFDDVREFPRLPFPADQPLPTDMPTSVGPPELLGMVAPGDLPAFLDQPAFPGRPAFPGQPALPDRAVCPSGPTAGGQAQPAGSGRRRARVAALAAVAIVVAALAGWFAYPRPASVDTASGSIPAVQGSAAAPGGGSATGQGRSAGPGTTASGGTSPGGAAPGTGQSPGAQVAAGAGGTAGSDDATTPAGYRWYQVSASSSGATAGFRVAVPASWTTSRQGLASYLRPPAGNAFIEISLAPFTYARPLREAAFLQARAIQRGLYPGYRLIVIDPGMLLRTPDAAWEFSWQGGGASRTDVLEVLATIDTAASPQPYTLTVSAPSDTFAAAEMVFRDVMQTFRPL